VINDKIIVVRHAVITIPINIDISIESSSLVVFLLIIFPVLICLFVLMVVTEVLDFDVC
jgi:hypothetical protein